MSVAGDDELDNFVRDYDAEVNDNYSVEEEQEDDRRDDDDASSVGEEDPKKKSSLYNAFKSTMNSVGIVVNSDLTDDTSYMKIRDPTLSAIGKQIKVLEAECVKNDEKILNEWTRTNKPPLEFQIRELTSKVEELKQRIEHEQDKGIEHIYQLGEEQRKHNDALEIMKKKYYFPMSKFVIGQSGM